MHASILDCTLRDGSYANKFGFDAEFTSKFVKGLSDLSIEYIEIGHGLGLGASSLGYGEAAETDSTYIKSAYIEKQNSKIGCFFIPKIGSKEDINKAVDLGLDFIRIGTNPYEWKNAIPFIEYSKNLGLEVFYNCMKSYALPQQELLVILNGLKSFELSGFYLVDSAGFMTPREVNKYITSLSAQNEVKIGFHAHNNLGLALASSLEAVLSGAVLIDCTIKGIGRMGGNTQLEIFHAICEKSQIASSLVNPNFNNLYEMIDDSWMLDAPSISPINKALGIGGIHSSIVPKFKEISKIHNVDVDRLIQEVGKYEQVNPSDELIKHIAKLLSYSVK